MADAIAKGDVVMLKSGGHEMTVSKVEAGRATCDWFVGNERHVHSFDLAVLVKVVKTPPPPSPRPGFRPPE